MRALLIIVLGTLCGVGASNIPGIPFILKGSRPWVSTKQAASTSTTATVKRTAVVNPPNLFRFSSTSTGTGTQPGRELCTDGQKETIETWLSDMDSVLSTILPAMDKLESGESDLELLRNLYTWFGIRKKSDDTISDESQDDFNDVREMYDLVQSYLNQQMQSLLGDHKPWLYCDSTWLQEMTVVYDMQRQPLLYIDSNGATQNVAPRTTPPDAVSNLPLQDQLHDWQRKEPNGDWSFYPYYAPEHNEGVTEPYGHQYRGDPPSFCNGVDNDEIFEFQEGRYVGLDEDAIPTITICPRIFTTGLLTLREAFDSPLIKERGTPLAFVLPQSLVLFHELMHAVDPGNTPDNCYGVTDCLQARRAGEDLIKTPDALVLCAYSYYLSQQGPEPKSSWATGVAKTY